MRVTTFGAIENFRQGRAADRLTFTGSFIYCYYAMAIVNKDDLLSVKETAFLANVSDKTVWHAVAIRIVEKPGFRARPGPRFEPEAVTFFRLLADLTFELPRESKRDLFAALTHGESTTWRREGTRLVLHIAKVTASLEIDAVESEVNRRVAIYRTGRRDRVASSPDTLGGEPVFTGTRIPVRHVGALVKRGVSIKELSEDFPKLSAEDFEFARMFLELGPPPGRPRKRLRFKRVPASRPRRR